MTVCKICGKEFKRLTSSHLKTHDYTMEQYINEFDKEKAQQNELIKFLNDYYITLRREYYYSIYQMGKENL